MIAYYDNTGKILGGCYADSVDALKTITKIPDGCIAIYVDDRVYPNVWGDMGQYMIQNGVPVYVPIPDSVKLQGIIDAKVAELTNINNSANPTFQSSALGSPHTYLSDKDAMGKLIGEYTFINSPAYDEKPILWFTLEAGGVNHTKDQFNQVYLDGRKTFTDTFLNWDSKVKQARSITLDNQTIEEAIYKVTQIVWE